MQVATVALLATIVQPKRLSFPKYAQEDTTAQLVLLSLFCVLQATTVQVGPDKQPLALPDSTAWVPATHIKNVRLERTVHQPRLNQSGAHQVPMDQAIEITLMLPLVVLNADVVYFQHLMRLDNA